MLQTKVCSNIDEIGRNTINSFSENFFFTYEWLKTIETAKVFRLDPKYIVVYDGSHVVAVAPCFVEYTSQYQTMEDILLPSGRKIGKFRLVLHKFMNPSLVCYSPSSFQSRILTAPDTARFEVLRLILEQMDEICREQRILLSSFKFVSESDALLFKNLESFGYMKFFLKSNMFIDIKWTSFDEYLMSIKNASTRYKIRKEIKINEKAGIKIEEGDVGSLSGIISELYANLYRKYNRKASPLTPIFFETLDVHTENKALLFLAKKRDKILGFSLYLKHKQVWDAYIVGFDYKSLGKDYTYFNVTYYAPIKKAISERAKRINFRPGTYEAKRRRGCNSERLYLFIKCNSLLAPAFNRGLPFMRKYLGIPYSSHLV